MSFRILEAGRCPLRVAGRPAVWPRFPFRTLVADLRPCAGFVQGDAHGKRYVVQGDVLRMGSGMAPRDRCPAFSLRSRCGLLFLSPTRVPVPFFFSLGFPVLPSTAPRPVSPLPLPSAGHDPGRPSLHLAL